METQLKAHIDKKGGAPFLTDSLFRATLEEAGHWCVIEALVWTAAGRNEAPFLPP